MTVTTPHTLMPMMRPWTTQYRMATLSQALSQNTAMAMRTEDGDFSCVKYNLARNPPNTKTSTFVKILEGVTVPRPQ